MKCRLDEKVFKIKMSLPLSICKRMISPQLNYYLDRWRYYRYFSKKYSHFLDKQKNIVGTGEKPKIIWTGWLGGRAKCPEICEVCFQSVERLFPDYEIRFIDESTYKKYIILPDYIINKYDRGIIPKPNMADIIRAELLSQYGGIWIDSTVFFTSRMDNEFSVPLFCFQNWRRGDDAINLSSWLISSEKNNPIIVLTRDLLYEYWKKYNYLQHYFILSSYLHTREEFRRVLNHSRIMTMPPYRVAISKAFREASAFLRICRFQG
jgi:hypothetical protein